MTAPDAGAEPGKGRPAGSGGVLPVTIALIIIGAVLLIVGFARDSLPVIWASVVCSVFALVAVFVLGRLVRRRAVRDLSARDPGYPGGEPGSPPRAPPVTDL